MKQEQKKKKDLTKNDILSFLREHKEFLLHNFGVTKIALFGSYARGEETEASDIDLLVEVNDYSFDNRCNLKDYLESHLQKTVDLGYFDALRTFVKRMIEKEIMYV